MVRGTRVPVTIILGQLVAGEDVKGVADGYGLTREQVLDCLAFALDRVEKYRYHPGAKQTTP